MESIKNAANSVSESIQGAGATASKEANKEVAKDSNASAGTRYAFSICPCSGPALGPEPEPTQIMHANRSPYNSLNAAKDAIGDKIDESTHNAKSDAHKEAAK